jgi:hypothetical protein
MMIRTLWSMGTAVLALVVLPALTALPASFEALVPGEMLTDEEIDPYYGKGVEGVDVDTGDMSPVNIDFQGTQNNVDDFFLDINSSAGGQQGIVLASQLSGDNARVYNSVIIDININGVELGGPVNAVDLDNVDFSTNQDGSTITITGSADINRLIDLGTGAP